MDRATLLGIAAGCVAVVAYANEARSHWWTLAFAAACLLIGLYAFLVHAWVVGVLETAWYLIAMRRWAEGRRFT